MEVVVAAGASLGEGPVWDGAREELVWVDIDLGRVHRYSPCAGPEAPIELGQAVGCAVPRTGGGLMLALRDGFAFLPEGASAPEPVATIEPDRSETRMNDGACDRRGRFWAGTMTAGGSARGALYRLDPDLSVTRVLTGVSTSNGVGWSPDGTRMYYVDSPLRRVDVFEFDLDTGTLADRCPLFRVPADRGLPDGLAVDAEGALWLALWGGGAVERYSPHGRLDARLELPVRQVTSCSFGDHDRATLYVTTASRGLAIPEPLAGALFACRPGVAGLAATPFGG
jgi:sugar lactone lactonase YvrE